MKGIVVVPAFNEQTTINEVLKKIPGSVLGIKLDVVVVDDGSVDNTYTKASQNGRVTVLRHIINRGLGAALGTGFEYAKARRDDVLITLDADGQHDPKEIVRLLKPIVNGQADFVVGSRVNQAGMPVVRRLVTALATLITYFFTGVWTSDSQSGFRAFSKKAIQNIKINVDKMEISTNFFWQAKQHHLKIKEVDITPIYTQYSNRKGQNYLNSANIIAKLLLVRLIR